MKVHALLTVALASIFVNSSDAAMARFPILRCSDTSLSSGAYGSYFLSMYHSSSTSSSVCGGDPLTRGFLMLDTSTGNIRYRIDGANPHNLYEVYYLPSGGDPVADRSLIGQFLTGSTGRGTNSFIRSISTPSDGSSGPLVDFWSATGATKDLGLFFVYSRGPYYNSGTGMYNTADGSATTTLINPVLWGGSAGFDMIQFASTVGFF